jgi:hypothetical protein
MVALVAMLLVAAGGSVRTGGHRTSASSGSSLAAPHIGRHAAVVAPSAHDHVSVHPDLASTPPDQAVAQHGTGADDLSSDADTLVTGDAVTPVGRAPPAL